MIHVPPDIPFPLGHRRLSPIALVFCLVFSLSVHAAMVVIVLRTVRNAPLPVPNIPLICELVLLPEPETVAPQTIPAQLQTVSPSLPEPAAIPEDPTRRRPSKKHTPAPPASKETQSSPAPSKKKNRVYQDLAPTQIQSLDTIPKKERTVIQKITAKHHLTWRSLISPDYGRNDFVGHYTVEPGRFLSILANPDNPGDLILLDSRSGRLHHLKRKEALHYTYGPDARHDTPVLGVVLFMPVKDDMDQNPLVNWTSRLMWIPENSPAIMADKVKLDETDVVFFNGDNIISARLTRPQTEVPQPGVVWVSNGDCKPENMATGLARIMAVHGYAFLSFEARGCGESSGDHATATTEQLASDVLAAHEFLSQNAGISPERVFVWGAQAGCLPACLACAQNSKIPGCVVTLLPPLDSKFPANLQNPRGFGQPALVIAARNIMPKIHDALNDRPRTEFIAVEYGCANATDNTGQTSRQPNWDRLAPALAGAVSGWLQSVGGK